MTNPHHTTTVPRLLNISGVSIDFGNSGKNVESAEVRIGKSHRPIEREAGKVLQQTFSPPLELFLGDLFSLHVRWKKWFGRKIEHEDVNFDTEDMFRVSGTRGEPEKQEYIKFHKKIKIVVELSRNTTTEQAQQLASSDDNVELQPTTDEIIRICPRFRILVIGKTGVGKSSLINHAFGVENAFASHIKPGEADIDHEFTSPQNDRFVLHDSKGFEPGDEDNVNVVRGFIERRRNMPDLKDQLHAVWLCFEIPRAGGRLLETGTEAFLKLKLEGELGKIPVVVVFTKFDKLIDRMERTLDRSSVKGLNKEDVKKLSKTKAETELQDICTRPLQKFAGHHMPNIPHVAISTNEDHRETLASLIRMTENHVHRHLAPEASVMTSIAQRVDPQLKINASIEVGKRRYWKALGSCTAFKNRTAWDCLQVLHTDIIAVWNFHDPDHLLDSPEFKTIMVNMIDKIDVGPTIDPKKNMAVGLSMVGTLAGIMAALAGPAAPIVVPIAAGVVFAVWVRDVYRVSRVVLQRFISYIVDLTLVLQTLYLVSGGEALSRRAIKLAVKAYHDSPISGRVHTGIQQYDRELSFLDRRDRNALDKIIELVQFYSIDAVTISGLRKKIPAVGSLPDELWEVEKA